MKARVFNIMQYGYHPFDAYDDDGNLLPSATPLLTQEQIEDGLNHKSIKRWAYAWHDCDVYSEKDEADDVSGRKRAGDVKPPHCHIVLECPNKLELSAIARWFGVPEQYIDVPKGKGAFLDCVQYLTHESDKEQSLGKHLYSDDCVVSNFDWRAELNARVERRAKYGKNADGMNAADVMRMHVLKDGWTMRQCRDDDCITYAKIRNSLLPLRLDYLMDSDPCPFRLTIYVEGPTSVGKSSFCEYLAQELFRGYEDPYFCTGGDERVTFDGYDGQPVIIWDDVRAEDFVEQFKPQGTFRILDPHPKKIAQQAKNSRVILTNALNIICGTEPFVDFISGLSRTRKELLENSKGGSEDETQSWRRVPLIFCVHEDSYDIMINEGFVNKDISALQSVLLYENVRGSMKDMMELLEGEAISKKLYDFSRPALNAISFVQSKHDAKISNPDDIPEEFALVGETTSFAHVDENGNLVRDVEAIAKHEMQVALEKHQEEADQENIFKFELFTMYQEYLNEYKVALGTTQIPQDTKPLSFLVWQKAIADANKTNQLVRPSDVCGVCTNLGTVEKVVLFEENANVTYFNADGVTWVIKNKEGNTDWFCIDDNGKEHSPSKHDELCSPCDEMWRIEDDALKAFVINRYSQYPKVH